MNIQLVHKPCQTFLPKFVFNKIEHFWVRSKIIKLILIILKQPVDFLESGVNRKRTKFQPTVAMSVYLVSFAVVPDDYGMITTNLNGVNVIKLPF